MNIQAKKAFLERVKQSSPTLSEVILGWPSEDDDFSYPYLTILVTSSRLERYIGQKPPLLKQADSITYGTGIWHSLIHLHLFFQTMEQNDLAEADLLSLFSADLQKEDIAGSFDLKFGPNQWEIATFRLLENTLDSDASSLKKGERRRIISISAESPQIQVVKQPILKDLRLDPHISEKQQITGVR